MSIDAVSAVQMQRSRNVFSANILRMRAATPRIWLRCAIAFGKLCGKTGIAVPLRSPHTSSNGDGLGREADAPFATRNEENCSSKASFARGDAVPAQGCRRYGFRQLLPGHA